MISWIWPQFSNAGYSPFSWDETWHSRTASLPARRRAPSPTREAARSRNVGDAADNALAVSALPASSVVALVGLAFEARIAAGPGVLVVCRGVGEADVLQLAVRGGCRSIISFGVAGGLAPDLVPGDCIVASAVMDYPTLRPTDPNWSRTLQDMIPGAHYGPIVGVNSVVSHPDSKQKLYELTGALAVDMESHLVARLAACHGLDFAAVRVVVDPAHRAVPAAALLAMGAGGSTDISSLLRELLLRPWQVSALMRLAVDAYAARAALIRLRRMLGPGFSRR